MSRVVQTLQRGLVLSLMMGAIAACQQATNIPEQSATETPPDQTEQTDSSESAASSSDTGNSTDAESSASTAANNAESSAQSKAPAPKPIPSLPAECATPETQTAMNICAQAEYEQADVKLNNAYQAVKAAVSGERVNQLITAEEAWINYRDRYCDFAQAQFTGGSMQPLVYSNCMEQVTQDRTVILEEAAPNPPAYESIDAELNAVYQDLQAELSSAQQDQLTDAQLAWIDYRDAHCAFERGDMNTCLAQLTLQQTNRLQEQLQSQSL